MALTRIRRPEEDIEGIRFKTIADRFGLGMAPQQEERNASEMMPRYGPEIPPPDIGRPITPESEAKIGLPESTGEPTRRFQTILDQINEAYKPETRDTEAYRSLLEHFPQRESPSIARRLVASGLALGNKSRGIEGGIDVAEKAMYAPYYRDLADWKEKAPHTYNLANLERQENIQNRTLITNALQYETQQGKNDIALIRANAYRAKQEGAEIVIDKNSGQVVAKYEAGPKKGTVEYLGKVPGTSTEAELADIRGKYLVDAARQRGMDIYEATALRGLQPVQDQSGNTYILDPSMKRLYPVGNAPPNPTGPITEVAPPRAGQTAAPEVGRQGMEARAGRVELAHLQHPEWRQFITLNSDGSYTPNPSAVPGRWASEATHKAYNEFSEYVASGKLPGQVPPGQPQVPGQQQIPGQTQQDINRQNPPAPGNVLQSRPPSNQGNTTGPNLPENASTIPGGLRMPSRPETAPGTMPWSGLGRQPTPPGMVRVISPDGKSGTIPAEQLPAALQQGYRKAR